MGSNLEGREDKEFDAETFLREFQDYCAPTLDMYEQAIYLYAVRHSRLIGQSEVVIGFKTARKNLAFGIGKAGTPPSEDVVYKKSRSLHEKGLLRLMSSERSGTRLKVFLPRDVKGLVPFDSFEADDAEVDLETLDFFENSELRPLILEREGNLCFYCRSNLNAENYVLEHVVSRPLGDNTYRNLVASCRRCNNRKSEMEALDFLRILFREELLSADEFAERKTALELLAQGKLRPRL